MDCIEADPLRFTPGAALSSDARPRSASKAEEQDQCSPLGWGYGANENQSRPKEQRNGRGLRCRRGDRPPGC